MIEKGGRGRKFVGFHSNETSNQKQTTGETKIFPAHTHRTMQSSSGEENTRLQIKMVQKTEPEKDERALTQR